MRATGHPQPGSPHAITSNHAAPGPAPPSEEHTPLPTNSHASPSTTPPKPHPQQSQQQPQPQQQQQQEQQQHVHTPDSGQLADLQDALAKCKQRTGNSTSILDLSGRTFKGELKGPLVIASNTSLVNGVLQLPSRSKLLIHGAQGVTLKDLIIRGTTKTLLVYVCEGSNVSMHGCTVEGGEAVIVMQGSSLKATDCVMRSSSGSGLQVLAGGRAKLDRCECEGYSSKAEIVVVDGCSVELGSSITAKSCTFSCKSSTANGLLVSEGAKAVLHGCVCSQNSGKGIHVSGSQSSLIASDCNVCCNSGVNIQVLFGASAVLNGCNFYDSKKDGIRVEGLGTYTLLRATGCSVSRNECLGVLINNGARAQLSSCVVEDNKMYGLAVHGSATTASATECLINQNDHHNVSVMDGAHLDIHACEANHSRVSSGLNACGEGSVLVCSNGTSAHGNHWYNLKVSRCAVAELTADCVMGQAAQQ